MDDNNADLYDCDVICKGTSDGFPMCDCGLSPPVRLIPKIPKKTKKNFPKKENFAHSTFQKPEITPVCTSLPLGWGRSPTMWSPFFLRSFRMFQFSL